MSFKISSETQFSDYFCSQPSREQLSHQTLYQFSHHFLISPFKFESSLKSTSRLSVKINAYGLRPFQQTKRSHDESCSRYRESSEPFKQSIRTTRFYNLSRRQIAPQPLQDTDTEWQLQNPKTLTIIRLGNTIIYQL